MVYGVLFCNCRVLSMGGLRRASSANLGGSKYDSCEHIHEHVYLLDLEEIFHQFYASELFMILVTYRLPFKMAFKIKGCEFSVVA